MGSLLVLQPLWEYPSQPKFLIQTALHYYGGGVPLNRLISCKNKLLSKNRKLLKHFYQYYS